MKKTKKEPEYNESELEKYKIEFIRDREEKEKIRKEKIEKAIIGLINEITKN